MSRLLLLPALLAGFSLSAAAAGSPPDKTASTEDFAGIRAEVELLRGKTFTHEVPVYKISEKELRAISDRAIEKELPGPKLARYEELLTWLDIIPPGTHLKGMYADFLADQVAGLYDSDTKEMCIPAFSTGATNLDKRAAAKNLDALSAALDKIVLAHEFTHALEDQYWPIDQPADRAPAASTDRGTAHDFLLEGSATRLMIEAIPAQACEGSARKYFILWNLLHSGLGEFVLNDAIGGVWKSPDALTPGVPDAIARSEAMPYAFGYPFCSGLMRNWGLDGLDYMYDHQPVSSSQIMHPVKAWQWHDWPVRIAVSTNLPGGWQEISSDSLGESGIAVLLGTRLKSLNRGLAAARGWDGDHAALFERAGGRRLFVWASSWNGKSAASRFAEAWMREREKTHAARRAKTSARPIEWSSPDGRRGLIAVNGQRVVILESDDADALTQATALADAVQFTEPEQDSERAAQNSALLRYNPLVSWQKDGGYTVTRSLGGLLTRHDHNEVGHANSILLGIIGSSRQTKSFHNWEAGGGLIVRHLSEQRRGYAKTTLLPWGMLFARNSAPLPQEGASTLSRTTVLWGLFGSATQDAGHRKTENLLPFGLLFHRVSAPAETSLHVLGTGRSRTGAADSTQTTRFRIFGIPIYTSHRPPNGAAGAGSR
jgi:hypothetical protein